MSLKYFSWARVRECLSRYEELVNNKQIFAHDDCVFLDMLWSGSLLLLSPKRVGIYDRNDYTKLKYTALPPKDIQLTIKGILERYGRETPTGSIH